MGGLTEHPGGGLATRADDAEARHRAVRVVRADVDSVELNAVAGEEPSEPLVHQVHGGLAEQPARQSALVGDDDQGEAVLTERGQSRAEVGVDLGRVAAAARGVALDEVAQRGRDGITGPRRAGAIGFAALRGGDNIGEHHVIFAGIGERLEVVHRATNRAIYAKGAVRAARWLVGRPPGLYGMKEVLGL